MKIKLVQDNNYCHYSFALDEISRKQEEYDYIFKYLDFDKLENDWCIHFNDKEVEEWFKYVYIDEDWLNAIYKKSPEGYQYLKEHWGKGVFRLFVWYTDKQELKIIVNKIINVRLMRK